jgi:hypothetical protein
VQAVGEPGDRVAERGTPSLMRVTAHAAAAVRPPPLDAVRAAPRTRRADLDVVDRRVSCEVGREVLEARGARRLEVDDDAREGHLAEPVVMSVRFPVRGGGHEATAARVSLDRGDRGERTRREGPSAAVARRVGLPVIRLVRDRVAAARRASRIGAGEEALAE